MARTSPPTACRRAESRPGRADRDSMRPTGTDARTLARERDGAGSPTKSACTARSPVYNSGLKRACTRSATTGGPPCATESAEERPAMGSSRTAGPGQLWVDGAPCRGPKARTLGDGSSDDQGDRRAPTMSLIGERPHRAATPRSACPTTSMTPCLSPPVSKAPGRSGPRRNALSAPRGCTLSPQARDMPDRDVPESRGILVYRDGTHDDAVRQASRSTWSR